MNCYRCDDKYAYLVHVAHEDGPGEYVIICEKCMAEVDQEVDRTVYVSYAIVEKMALA